MAFLEITSLQKRFGGLKAADNVSLSLEKGSLTALVGPNGCGKSTLFNLITGAIKPDAGKILFDGRNITGDAPQQIARYGIGRKFQVPAIFSELTVRENLTVPFLRHRRLLGRKTTDMNRINQILKTIKLTDKSDSPAEILSHGEKQWLEIGMILGQSPLLILLDEPTAGMTASETAATAQLIREINMKENVTLLVIEHDIGFIEQLDCPVSVMARGAILKSGNFKSIRNDPEVQELYFGRAEAPHA
ncbi:ATP-binding cassette domain-containing protein [Sneathiella sp.]|jgi:urea ABC transporter ATP-binding protein UrtD|uniref:ATP-binding cassette domain-containing protein n=1 Tax=Sneathiella sp. TaxID=1964365 RepID=UPI0039E2ACE1